MGWRGRVTMPGTVGPSEKFSTEPNRRDVSLTYTDAAAEPGGAHYYYVRIQQADGNLAWGSPMWITYKP